MHTQKLCNLNFSFLMFQSLKSPVLLTFLKCYFIVITVFAMRDLFLQMELFTISPEWEERGSGKERKAAGL